MSTIELLLGGNCARQALRRLQVRFRAAMFWLREPLIYFWRVMLYLESRLQCDPMKTVQKAGW